MQDIKESIMEVGKDIYDHGLTSVIGGNISVRGSDGIIVTPSGAGVRWHWKLKPDDFLTVDLEGKIIDGVQKPTKDLLVHLLIHKNVPIANAVIHAHPDYVLSFVLAGKPIPPLTEMAEKSLGEVTVAKWGRGGTRECAEYVSKEIVRRQKELEKHGIGVIIPRHGIVIVGKSLTEAHDALGRAVENAQAQLFAKLIG